MCNTSDPFGLFTQYNEYGDVVGDKGGDQQDYLEYQGKEYKLDRPLVSNQAHTSYRIHADGAGDRMAEAAMAATPRMSRVRAAFESRPGGRLDFKSHGALANPRQLFIQGDAAVHTDVIGNEAWGYYDRTKLGLSVQSALAWAERFSFGHDDPQDQAAIRRAYILP
jgi:hypothetical protein